MKIKYLILCILIMSFIISPIAVFAESESKTQDIIITNLTEEEIEELTNNIQFFAATSEMKIARWTKTIDNTKSDVNGFSVPYYFPIYEGEYYKNYITCYVNGGRKIIFYPDSTTFANGDYRFLSNGKCIEISVPNVKVEELKTYLFDSDADDTRLEITGKLHETSNSNYGIFGGAYEISYQYNSTNHSDTYYAWYKTKYGTEPPKLNDDGTCAVHTYSTITKTATCTEPGGTIYTCTICNYSYFQESTEKLPHTYENNICTVCGAEYTPTTPGGSGGPDIDYGDLSFLGKVNAVVQSKLNDNSMYNSLLYIVNTLSSLFTEDYTSAEGFYALGLTNLNVNKPYVEYSANYGNDIIGDFEQTYQMQTSNIDWGLNNVQVMNLDWYFGKVIGYSASGTPYITKGVKKTSDTIISGFLWLVFGYNVYINMPNLIAGEGGQIVSATSSASGYFNKRKEKENKPKGDKAK